MPRSASAARSLLAAALLALAAPVRATPLDHLPVGDPLEAELRILDLLEPRGRSPFALPRLHSRPLHVFEIPAVPAEDVARAIAFERIARWRARDLPGPAAGRTTPRLFAAGAGDDAALELSAALEGRAVLTRDTARVGRASGLQLRAGARIERWVLHSHLVAGHVPGGRRFADPLIAGSDLIVHTEDTWLGHVAASGRWAVRAGRTRWHWGPGEEGSLLLSRTAPAITGVSAHARFPALRLDVAALHATLAAAAGEHLAAHRVEWQARDGLRLGLAEAARYRADRWDLLYAAGVVPYVLVQRLAAEDEPDSAAAHRNNVMIALDAAWRVADGTRIYGELLLDDVRAEAGDHPHKLAWQLGLEGAGTVTGRRITWGVELTRISRWVYTSFFGRTHAARGEPVGFFTGPDARRVRVRGALDLSASFQVLAAATHTTRGEGRLDDPFVPGVTGGGGWSFAGVAESAREAEAGLRWWPASGVDLAVSGGFRRVRDAGHLAGAAAGEGFASLSLRLIR